MNNKLMRLNCLLQGFDPDESDAEWDQDIREQYGARGQATVGNGRRIVDEGANMERLVQHTFHVYDSLVGTIGNVQDDDLDDTAQGENEVGRDRDTGLAEDTMDYAGEGQQPAAAPDAPDTMEEDMADDDLMAMEQGPPTPHQILEESATTPLFPGSGLTQLGGTLLLLNSLRTHNASNQLVNEIFGILSKSLLPKVNSLPKNEYQASKVLKQLGLGYETIHCCPGPKTCILFRGPDYKELSQCPKCHAERYKMVGKSKVPAKVLRWFPLIPRLQRMYSTPLQASYMTWHARHESEDGVMRGVVDSHQWKYVNWRWREEFAQEPRNLRLGLATDGVNPFSVKRSTWSTWPVLILNYNLPPWMTTKRHFIMLSLIIPGKKSVTGENFDVYLQPLLEELQILWATGVPTDDASKFRGSSQFNMKAILLWTIHDFPAYGIVAGCVTKGYRGCPVCGPNTISRRSLPLHKNVYDNQYRRYLPMDHPWRRSRPEWGGVEELRGPPGKVTATDIQHWGHLRERWVAEGSTPAAEDPARLFGIKRVSALFQLPYWQVRTLHFSPPLTCFPSFT